MLLDDPELIPAFFYYELIAYYYLITLSIPSSEIIRSNDRARPQGMPRVFQLADGHTVPLTDSTCQPHSKYFVL